MELTPKTKKVFAAVAVCALVVVIIAVVLIKGGGMDEGKKDEEPPVPPYEIPPNVPVTTLNKDNNEPSIAINPADPLNMVAGSNDYNTAASDAWPGYYTTHDGGDTWSEGLLPGHPGDSEISQLSGFKGGGDAVLVCGNDGVFYYAGIAFERSRNPLNPIGFGIVPGLDNCVFVARSDNGGDSFDQVVVVWTALHSLVRFNDKEWVAVDPNNSDNVYMVWAIFYGLVMAKLMWSASHDGGQTWSPAGTISETRSGEMSIQGSAVNVDENGDVHVTWIDFGNNNVRYAKSSDKGSSFSTPVDVAPIDPIPRYLENGNYRVPTMTMLDVDMSGTNTSGNLYVTWADQSMDASDIFLAYSHDNGASWNGPVRVNNDTEGNGVIQFFPAVSVSEEGWVHVTFYDRRNDANNTLLEYWWAVSFDGGQTFPINVPVSDTQFNGDHSRDGDRDFIGDYTGVDTINSTLACVWCDTREGSDTNGDTEIYASIFNYQEFLRTKDMGVEVPSTYTDEGFAEKE
jgi:hypothetical protein